MDKETTHESGGKRNMGILFSPSDHNYSRVPTRDCEYQGRQGLKKNEKFVNRVDIK